VAKTTRFQGQNLPAFESITANFAVLETFTDDIIATDKPAVV
jgi:hypothetical protein